MNEEAIHNPALAQILEADRARHLKLLLWGTVAAVCILASFYITGLLDPQRLAEGGPSLVTIAGEMFPPDFARWQKWVNPLADTLAMSIGGTVLAIALSFPLAFLAAKTTSPNGAIYQTARMTLNGLRAIPELIMGIIFVAAVGFGALPGVLALGLHSVGMVGKFFAEAIEHVDPRPIEAARAAGATEFQVVWRAILPQVLPQMADTTIYRWEYNFRASTVMGAVGAGGIGTELMGSLRLMDYQQVSAILLCILVCVTAVDAIGSVLRRKLV